MFIVEVLNLLKLKDIGYVKLAQVVDLKILKLILNVQVVKVMEERQ